MAGMSEDVTKIDRTFRQLLEETTKIVERIKQTKTEMLSMSPTLYQIMCNSGLQKKILDQVPELKIDYDMPTKKVCLSGLREEVLTAKCEILIIKEQLKSKSIQMNPYLVEFLHATDNENLSSLMFVRHNINALLEIEDGAVTLIAYSKEDLTAAEKQIGETLLHRELLVEDKSLLGTPEWRSLHSHLNQLYNADKCTVLIKETSSGTTNNLVITGMSSDVLKCHQQLSDFLKTNTITIEHEIPVKTSAMIKFIWEEKKEILEKIKTNVKVTKNQNNISLSGPRLKVQEAANAIRDILRSLHCDTLRIEKPGAKKFFKNMEEMHAAAAKTTFHCVIHLQQTFASQLANCTEAATSGVTTGQSAGTESTFFGMVTDQSLGVHEMKVGSITFQVKTGDITKEESEIIVNSSNANFTLRKGVSKAILEAAGQAIALSAAQQGSQPHNGYVITGPGNLRQCKWIFHVAVRKRATPLKKIIQDVLHACENNQASSVTFPAIGTGDGGMAASTVADSILDGLVEFIKSKSVPSLQTVKVIIFQQPMLNDFYTSMKKREGTALPEAKSFFTRINELFMLRIAPKQVQKLTDFQLMDGIEPIFTLCAEDKTSVDNTKVWLQKQIEHELVEKVIREECISELGEAEVKKISNLEKKFQVSVMYKPPDPSIRIQGLTRDVMAVSEEIEMIISQVKDMKNKEQAAELTSNLVEWSYDNGGNMVPFDNMTNLELEEAKIYNKVQIAIQIRGLQYSVSLQTKKATDQHGNKVQIQRNLKNEGESLTLPLHWKPMSANLVIEVDVAPGTPEYSTVQKKLQSSNSTTILKVLRVQNRDLWFNYQIKKQNFDSKNGFTNNEKELFHGTDSNSIQHVNKHGFNRSYAGKNGTVYGDGTYFAVNANYSVHFAIPDGNGQRHMCLARVLTGIYCQGQSGMKAPPAKNAANTTDLYDSVTDNMQNPSMFVIFNDIQAYPEYHIIFQ